MTNFQVNFLVTDWISVDVKAKNEAEAKEKAEGIIKKSSYADKRININDGKDEYIGFFNSDLVDKLN